jgi:ABC-2 type transport system ATP-binding protein
MTLTSPAAQLTAVSKSYDGKVALRSVSLDIEPGGVIALLGPNGAGKTTTVKLLLGLAAPTSGSVTVFGGDPRRASSRRRVGAMLQVGKVPETLRVSEHVDLFRTYYPNPMPTAEIFAAAGLDGLGDRKFGDLSGGQRQRLLFALAICGDPDMLFLDEPTLGFDVETRRSFWEQIRAFVSRGRTILLTTHYMEEADELADRVVVIDHGSIIADGTPAEIKRRVSGHRIHCTTKLSEAELRTIPGVAQVRYDRGNVDLVVTNAEAVTRDLLWNDESLSDLEVSGIQLEEAFLALTQPQEAA